MSAFVDHSSCFSNLKAGHSLLKNPYSESYKKRKCQHHGLWITTLTCYAGWYHIGICTARFPNWPLQSQASQLTLSAWCPVTQSFGVFFDLCLNKRLSRQSWGWWCETPSCSLWRHVPFYCWKTNGPIYMDIQAYCLWWRMIPYIDVIMSAMASQINGVLLNRLLRCRWKKTSNSASLEFVMVIHWWPVDFLHKGPVIFHLMTSSCTVPTSLLI